MRLTNEQKNVITRLTRFEKDIQTLGGYAGTGKTTVIQNLIEFLPNWAVCAFTGKAVNVLRKKGVEAPTTIHSLIYECRKGADGRPLFFLSEDIDAAGIIVDEASMVGSDLDMDLRSFNRPIIYVGDHGQLEPVADSGFNLMKRPDFTLEKIHRNAGEIAHFADHIRQGYKPSSWSKHGSGSKIEFIEKNEINHRLLEVDQTICAFNKTRVRLNKEARRQLGYPKDELVVGDRIMCLRNNREKGLFNGMQGSICELFGERGMVFHSDGKDYAINPYDSSQFNQVKHEKNYDRDAPDPFDFTYAMTTHKSQGDEWGSTLVVEEKCSLWSHARWAYTAASRAKEKIFWVKPY